MKQDWKDRIGLAMYTVHKSVEQNMYESFLKIAGMGYRAIEFYGEPDFKIADIQQSLKAADIVIAGWHVEFKNLQEKTFGATVDYLHSVECPVAVIPCLGGKWNVGHGAKEECRDIWLRYIERINKINEKLRREGIRCGYHNHEHEFILHYEGVSVFKILFDSLSEDVIIEFDSGNCIEGGENPLNIVQAYQKRDMILHMKPYAELEGFNTVLGAEDDLNDWKALLDAHNKEYLWMLIESENEILPEMTNADLCMQGLKKIMN